MVRIDEDVTATLEICCLLEAIVGMSWTIDPLLCLGRAPTAEIEPAPFRLGQGRPGSQ